MLTLYNLIDIHKKTFYSKQNDASDTTLRLHVQAAFIVGAFSVFDKTPPDDIIRVFKNKELITKENVKDFDFSVLLSYDN